MSDCCDPEKDSCASAKKRACPIDRHACVAVEHRTVLHHLKSPWLHPLGPQPYYFCDNPNCAVVYFSGDTQVIGLDELRGPIGQKQRGSERLICYCFGVNEAQASTDPAVKAFVIEQTKLGNCDCDIRNPSGRCCLKDFP